MLAQSRRLCVVAFAVCVVTSGCDGTTNNHADSGRTTTAVAEPAVPTAELPEACRWIDDDSIVDFFGFGPSVVRREPFGGGEGCRWSSPVEGAVRLTITIEDDNAFEHAVDDSEQDAFPGVGRPARIGLVEADGERTVTISVRLNDGTLVVVADQGSIYSSEVLRGVTKEAVDASGL